MSFILEALKKSEQQRQQKNAPQQEVRKRTLSLQDRRRSRWPYWAVAGLLSLVLLSSWWFFNGSEPTQEKSSVVSQVPVSPVSPDQSSRSDPVINKPLVREESTAVVEPAPVPRDVSLATVVSAQSSTEEEAAPVVQDEPTEVAKSVRAVTNKQDVTNVVVEQARPEAITKPSQTTTPTKLPLYLDLSRELRDQMPRLAMSMHYYIADPARRMVRINNLMLHEGDWISNDLQVVEITPTGASLEFFGKRFEMRSGGR